MLAVTGFLIAAWVWLRSMKMQELAAAEQKRLNSELALSSASLAKEKAKNEELSDQTLELEKALAEAVSRRDEKEIAAAMWDLELERSYRQWRDVIVPLVNERNGVKITDGQKLAFAISQEVERLREEVGVSIRFDGSLDLDLDPETALGALRIAEELLALAAKKADEVSVSLDQPEEPSVLLRLECAGWELGDDSIHGDIGESIRRMAEKLEGHISWQAGSDSGLAVDVRLPAPAREDQVIYE